jgi:abelson tyrosine-protein kinase 1
MHKQANRPWLKRYIRRDEIMRDISECDSMLRDALTLFGVRKCVSTIPISKF